MSVNPEALRHHHRTAELDNYDLTITQPVEVELLVVAGGQQPAYVAPRVVEGTVTAGTPAALILTAKPGDRTVRIPWHAIATIRDAIPTHPATT